MASPPPRPAVGSPAFLDSAVFLALDLTPRHPDARALVEVLTERVLTHEADPLARGNQRRAVGLAKLRQAVSGIVGGLLRAWWHKAACRPVWRSNQAESFTPRPLAAAEPGGPDEAMGLVQGVGRRSFRRVIEVLQAEGLLEHRGGVRLPRTHRFRMGRGGQGKSARYWPTAALLALAQAQGLTPGSIAAAFRAPAPTRLPKLPTPIQLRPLRAKAWDALPLPRGTGLPPGDTDPHARHDRIRQVLVMELAEQNAFARSVPVQFPAEVAGYPPQWHRVFYGNWALQGRWYATGVGGDPELGQCCAYSSLKPEQRAELRIDGEPVVELDVSASHLMLLLGLAGAALPDGDPYAGLGLPRPVVKQWVLELCGKGQPPARWSRTLAADHPARAYAVKAVGAVVLARYPALRQAATVVPAELAEQFGRPLEQLVTHYLAAREAVAMSQAIRQLRLQGILALPVYDSLIVPAGAEAAARRAIAAGYVAVCGLLPRIQRKVFAAAPDEAGDPAY